MFMRLRHIARAKIAPHRQRNQAMTSPTYDFRQFQQELAALEPKVEKPPALQPPEPRRSPGRPLGKKALAAQHMAMVREEFLELRKRHDLTVVDVVAFFPEAEGIAYLEQLIAASHAKPRRTRKTRVLPEPGDSGSVDE